MSHSTDRRPAAVLMYHRIAEKAAGRETLCVPPTEFEEQMQYLKRAGYNVVPIEDLANAIRLSEFPERCVALTFDDGYIDSLTEAAPRLATLGLPATFFVVTDSMFGSNAFWWDTLAQAFLSDRPIPARLEMEIGGGDLLSVDTGTADEKRAAHARICSAFFSLDAECRMGAIHEILEWLGAGELPASAARPMTADEVRSLDAMPGMCVGSHTKSHLLLPYQTTEVKAHELRDSKSCLQEILGRAVTALCYPYGGYDPETLRLAHEFGYETALRIGNLSLTVSSNPLALPRYEIRAGDDFPGRLTELFGLA